MQGPGQLLRELEGKWLGRDEIHAQNESHNGFAVPEQIELDLRIARLRQAMPESMHSLLDDLANSLQHPKRSQD